MKKDWSLLLLAWLIATTATLGALFIGEVMLMTPCTLCWYQRIFMFPIAIILGIACFTDDRQGAVYALALALGGLAMAGYHTLLVAGLIPKSWVPCSAGVSCADQKLEILNGVQIPWLSLAAFMALAFLLVAYLRKSSR
ncbi:disulfide bond formation protein B [Malikia granosa]|jgi:disulfide bond formation protein DsbB|uniref:Disulfide bond formation protein B n=1 Tax=Malikia granosa TaxID=263067 RepID=A0A2S9K2L4_9BURK|nr:disulfide bond formation protein B [Malikia granosa]PRD64706.1 disulfide bond formation protein B [Malikia granosa]